MMPTADSAPCGTMAKQTLSPLARCWRAHAMNPANAATEGGGADMCAATTGSESSSKSAGASAHAISRTRTISPTSSGTPSTQRKVDTAGTWRIVKERVRRGQHDKLCSRAAADATPPSDALAGVIRPLELDDVLPDLLRLPRADVADLPVRIVVPALAGNRIGDRLAELMRARRCKRIEHRQAAAAAGAAGERHRGVEDLTRDVAVIAAEGLARRGAALHHLHARFEVDEVQGVRRRLRHRGVGRDLVLQHVLDGGVGDR